MAEEKTIVSCEFDQDKHIKWLNDSIDNINKNLDDHNSHIDEARYHLELIDARKKMVDDQIENEKPLIQAYLNTEIESSKKAQESLDTLHSLRERTDYSSESNDGDTRIEPVATAKIISNVNGRR